MANKEICDDFIGVVTDIHACIAILRTWCHLRSFVATQLQGGGNCANALTGAARLGLRPSLVTKVGDDSLGDSMIQVQAACIANLARLSVDACTL